jgi:hypothetical protein
MKAAAGVINQLSMACENNGEAHYVQASKCNMAVS